MKKLSNTFGMKTKKETSTLVLPTNVEETETVPRKILEEDYEFIREYAFRCKIKMLEATEKIHHKIREEVEEKSTSIIHFDNMDVTNQKSIRLTVEFNDYLKYLSNETRIPMKFIISFFVQHFKEELVEEMS